MTKLEEKLKGLRYEQISQIIIECPSVRHKINLKHILNKHKRIKHKKEGKQK